MLDLGIKIHRILELHYPAGYIFPRHSHNYFHYIYILDGEGQVCVHNRTYNASKGHLYSIPMFVEHELRSLKDFAVINIKFTSSHLLAEKLKNLRHLLDNLTENEGKIIKDVLHEALCAYSFSEELMNVYFTTLLLTILRREQGEDPIERQSNFQRSITAINRHRIREDELSGVLNHIHNNIEKFINVSELAEIAGYSEAYFCTLFKKQFGVTVLQYINHLKIQRAKDMMLYSNMNIAKIAESLGFDTNYFSRLFKQHTHVSPREYKKHLY